MTTKISNAAAKAALDAIVDLLDADSNPGYIEIRTGSQPAGPDAAATGTLLATLPLSATAFGDATDANPGAIALVNGTPEDDEADASGTVGWFRAYDGAGTAVIDGAATVTGQGGDMEINNIEITAEGNVKITAWNVSLAETTA